jgi:enoyl-CoA hydratase/carnithine racemase
MSKVLYEKRDRIAYITINRPEARNAIDPDVHRLMIETWADFRDDDSVDVAILTGAGDEAFCAGADLKTYIPPIMTDAKPHDIREIAELGLNGFTRGMHRITKPIIGAVNGWALAGGLETALACDIRIASEEAFFACAYGRIGASPDGGMTYFLPRVVGPSRALELLLEDPNLDAAAALEEGLVRKVVAPEELMDAAQAKAEELAAKAPHYVRMSKLLAGVSLENNLTEHLQLERHGIADSMATEDLRNGVKAFFGGEKPEFHGR